MTAALIANIHTELLQACWECANYFSYFIKVYIRELWQMAHLLRLQQNILAISLLQSWALAVFFFIIIIANLNMVGYHWKQKGFTYTAHLYMVLLCFATKSVCSAHERIYHEGKYHDSFFVQVKSSLLLPDLHSSAEVARSLSCCSFNILLSIWSYLV